MRPSRRALSLFIPDLFESESNTPPSDWLNRLPKAARRQWRRCDQIQDMSGMEACMLTAFQVEPADQVSIAEIMAMGLLEAPMSDGTWIIASPVYLLPDRDHVLLFDAKSLDIAEQESQAFTNALNALYQPDGWTFYPLSPMHWLAYSSQTIEAQCVALRDVHGKSMLHHLPQGVDAKALILMMNEIQMMLHSHPVNQQREQQGQPSVSGIWFHGHGDQIDSVTCPFDAIYGQNPLLNGLAKYGQIKQSCLPETLCGILDDGAWNQALVYVDSDAQKTDYLTDALDAIRQKNLGQLNLHTGHGFRFRFEPKQAYRFWRYG